MTTITRVVLAMFIVGFWLFLPIGLMLFDVAGFDQLDRPEVDEPETGLAGFFQWAGNIVQILGIYFQLLVFNIPGVNVFIRFIVVFLQILSAIFIGFMLRGN